MSTQSGPVPLSLDSLTDADRAALAELCARLTPGPLTLAECGRRLGMSRERARQIERKALAKMRRRLELNEANEGLARRLERAFAEEKE